MAPTATPMSLSAESNAKLAAVAVLVSIAVLCDLPEVCVLLGLVTFATMSNQQKKDAREWLDTKTSHRSTAIVGSLGATGLAAVLAVLFVLLAASLSTQLAVIGLSALSYMALYEFGKLEKKSIRSSCQASIGATGLSAWKNRPAAVQLTGDERFCSAAEVPSSPITGLDREVDQLLKTYSATRLDDATALKFAKLARKCILPIVPEAEITCVAHGNLELIGASGSKPEIEMVLTVDPIILAERLKAYFLKGQSRIQKSVDTLQPDLLQKTATKVLSERLTFVKFWRSQFSGPEPMIVLLIPVELGLFKHAIRLNFSVNTPYSLRLAKVLSKEHARTCKLMTVVNSWTRERCVANTSKGQPHAYAWGLMVIYFMRHSSVSQVATEMTTVELFKEFISFYDAWFHGQESPVSLRFTSSVVPSERAACGAPFIEDPFDSCTDVGESMTAEGIERVREELSRANRILVQEGAMLYELLERWAPPSTPTSP